MPFPPISTFLFWKKKGRNFVETAASVRERVKFEQNPEKNREFLTMGQSQIIIFALILFISVSNAPTVHGNAELRALMDLKASLDPKDKLLRSWTPDGDPCSGFFEGVVCNNHRKVANISLQGKGLSGNLSPAIAQLKCLSGLYLHYNSLSGEIPIEIANLTELNDLYLNVNNFSGEIPAGIGAMAALQVVELCCNQLTGKIPSEIESLKHLNVLSLQYNKLTGEIPSSIGKLEKLRRLDLSFNRFSGTIPATLADIPQLDNLDLRNNTLSGIVPSGLKKLNGGFLHENNPGLCGINFPSLRSCTSFDVVNVNQLKEPSGNANSSSSNNIPNSLTIQTHCSERHCSKSSDLPRIAVISSVITVSITLMGAGILTFFRYRRRKQKIGSTAESSEGRVSTEGHTKELSANSASPLVGCSRGWDPLFDSRNGEEFIQNHHQLINSFKLSLEEIESASQCFSDANLLKRNSFSAVYRGKLRDGSVVAIRSIGITSCKSEKTEFLKGLNLLTSLAHENLVRLRGFCCSMGRGECFLVYDFAPMGNLSRFLDVDEAGDRRVLEWPQRVSIIIGIAKGIAYLHGTEPNKPAIVHRNISVEKILLGQQLNPMIADSGLHSLLADDFVFSALKTSAAMGYLAPEYITTGRFTEKTDVFAFGVIILQILSGKVMLTSSVRTAAEDGRCGEFMDEKLKGEFSESEAMKLARIGMDCTQEIPNNRPNILAVIDELNAVSE